MRAHDDSKPHFDKSLDGDGLVELNAVNFSYPQRPGINVLHDLNISVSSPSIFSHMVCVCVLTRQ